MKITRHTVNWAILSLAAILALAAIAGFPILPPEAIAGLGMVPIGNIDGVDIRRLLVEQGDAFEKFVKRYDNEMSEIRAESMEAALKAQRPGAMNQATGQHMNASERKAFDGAVRALMAGDKARADQLFIDAKAMSASSGPDGGYMVHTQFSTGFTKVMAEISPVYRLARVIPLDPGTDSFEEPIDRDSAAAYWTGEQSARPETGTPELKLLHIDLEEIYAMPKVTQKLVDLASFDVMAWLQIKVGEAFGTKESAAFHTGDGVSKPRGFMSYDLSSAADSTRTWGAVQYIPTGGAAGFASSGQPADALVEMMAALKPQYRRGAVWLMNRQTAGVVRKFKDSADRYIWVDSLIEGQPSTLLGHPVEIDEDMPDLGADALPIAFGNINRAYTIIEKPGIKFLPDPFTAKPNVLLYSYRRVGGGMNNSEAIKLLRCSTT